MLRFCIMMTWHKIFDMLKKLHCMEGRRSEAGTTWLTTPLAGEGDFSNWLPGLLNVTCASAFNHYGETVGISRLYCLQIMRLLHGKNLSLFTT